MKNKLSCEVVYGGHVKSRVRADTEEKCGEREPACVAPTIVVCPPMEERTSPSGGSPQRGARLFRALGRRIARRAPRAPAADADDDSRSSSADSSVCERAATNPPSLDGSSCTTSEEGSESSERARRHRSTAVSIRRVLQSLSISPRSHSSAPERSRAKKNPEPRKILRPPVTYTYVRGLSGLPTQRVPRPRSFAALSGLNR